MTPFNCNTCNTCNTEIHGIYFVTKKNRHQQKKYFLYKSLCDLGVTVLHLYNIGIYIINNQVVGSVTPLT